MNTQKITEKSDQRSDRLQDKSSSEPYIYYDEGLKDQSRKNRKKGSLPEARIWKHILSRKQTGYKFTRERPIGAYIVDFYCAELKIIIEIDGDEHADKRSYDQVRTKYFQQLGMSVLRYTNRQVMMMLDGVSEDLKQKLEKREKEIANSKV